MQWVLLGRKSTASVPKAALKEAQGARGRHERPTKMKQQRQPVYSRFVCLLSEGICRDRFLRRLVEGHICDGIDRMITVGSSHIVAETFWESCNGQSELGGPR